MIYDLIFHDVHNQSYHLPESRGGVVVIKALDFWELQASLEQTKSEDQAEKISKEVWEAFVERWGDNFIGYSEEPSGTLWRVLSPDLESLVRYYHYWKLMAKGHAPAVSGDDDSFDYFPDYVALLAGLAEKIGRQKDFNVFIDGLLRRYDHLDLGDEGIINLKFDLTETES